MEANKLYPEAKDLTYGEFSLKFTWKAAERRWTPRKRGLSIGRIHFVSPGSGEKFYIRILNITPSKRLALLLDYLMTTKNLSTQLSKHLSGDLQILCASCL